MSFKILFFIILNNDNRVLRLNVFHKNQHAEANNRMVDIVKTNAPHLKKGRIDLISFGINSKLIS